MVSIFLFGHLYLQRKFLTCVLDGESAFHSRPEGSVICPGAVSLHECSCQRKIVGRVCGDTATQDSLVHCGARVGCAAHGLLLGVAEKMLIAAHRA
jgi:hypothetical protein